MTDELTHWRRWVNSMWPRDTAWLHRSRSTLIHVMACCLTAPSYYLNQYWLTIRRILHHSPEDNSYMEMPLKVATTMYLKITHLIPNYVTKATSPREQWVKRAIDRMMDEKFPRTWETLLFVDWNLIKVYTGGLLFRMQSRYHLV